MKHIFIMNPMAGKVDVASILCPEIEKIKAPDFEYEVLLTEYQGHGQKLSAKCAKEAHEKKESIRIYACGGDGTLNEVMAGAYGYEYVEVGCFPYGTGNDYVKNFGGAKLFQNIENVINGSSIEVDILETNQGISAEICTMGFDANVGYNTKHYKKLPLCHGQMAYNLSVIECLLHPIGSRFKITIDGEVYEDDYLMVCLANGTTYGGGFKAAPEADVCDGMVDIIIVNKVSRLYIAKIIAKYAKGTYQENCKVLPEFQHCITYLKGKHVVVEGEKDFVLNLDGECKVQKYVEVEVKDKAMKFILPAGITYKNY